MRILARIVRRDIVGASTVLAILVAAAREVAPDVARLADPVALAEIHERLRSAALAARAWRAAPSSARKHERLARHAVARGAVGEARMHVAACRAFGDATPALRLTEAWLATAELDPSRALALLARDATEPDLRLLVRADAERLARAFVDALASLDALLAQYPGSPFAPLARSWRAELLSPVHLHP